MLGSAVQFSHTAVRSRVQVGDTVVDATAGNGRDTEFLAHLVGECGRVYAFDIQREAIERTDRRLREADLRERVRLLAVGHELIDEHVEEEVAAVMFNLGYLPGGDSEVITEPGTTVRAIQKALQLLRPGGIITAVTYAGHDGGRCEREAVLQFCAGLDGRLHLAHHLYPLNRGNHPPSVVTIQRIAGE